MAVKVKVKRTALIAAIENRLAEWTKKYEKAHLSEEQAAALQKQEDAKWKSASIAVLRKAIQKVEAGDRPTYIMLPDQIRVTTGPELHESLDYQAFKKNVERTLSVLKMSDDEYLTLSERDEYSQYI